MDIRLIIGFVLVLCCGLSSGVSLYALFNMDGIEGTINFFQENDSSNVTIIANFKSYREPANYSWYITENLISYSDRNPCNKRALGNRVHDLSTKHQLLSIGTQEEQIFIDSDLTLHGINSVWEKSIVMEGPTTVCANILNLDPVRVAEARFVSTIAGSVTFRQSFINSSIIPSTIITVDLFHVASDSPMSSNHDWKILVTDILDTRSSRRIGTCEHLTVLYDPDNVNDANCTSENHQSCKKGDLTKKHGRITIGAKLSRYTRKVTFDAHLPMPDLDGSRHLYVAIYNQDSSSTILGCARINEVLPKESQVRFLSRGVRGYITFRQQSPLDPTQILVNLTNLDNIGVFYHVHLFPVAWRLTEEENVCSETSGHYNPFNIDRKLSPSPGNGTYDKYEIGDLSGKYGLLSGVSFFGEYIDPYITLYGQMSIIGRSVVIHKNDSSRWICANVEYPRPVATAIATFIYPFVGRVIFRQDEQNPLDDTTVFIESLTFNDGTKNISSNHPWEIHSYQPSNDSLDWKQRCVSAGPSFNPNGVHVGANGYRDCHSSNPFRCIAGDLTNKLSRVNIAPTMEQQNITRMFFTDVNLAVTGQSGIIGKSLVVIDENALKFRGNRMSCASINRRYPSRGRVSEWHSSGSRSDIQGRVIMEQYTEYDITSTSVELKGLNNLASGFHVHEVSVPVEFSFPCTQDAVYGHYNPFAVDPKKSPPPGVGSSDQYELGDLSGKYGTLEEADSISIEAFDSNLPLQGPYGVLGRSIVIHKKEKGERWTCGDVQPFVKENGRRIQAMASFHHPKGFAYGYVKLGQLEYGDGSLSDTTIEVSLRYPGAKNKNITTGHRWAVFVSQVGEDLTVKAPISRCLAAGYRWNPFRVMSERDDYEKNCNARNPFACEMGDVSGRQGTIDVGGSRKVFTDANLPLAGNYTVMKKSIVIFEKNGNNLRFACANILPDNDITQKVQIKKLNRISGKAFIDKARERMAVPEWMMYIVDGETKDMGNCVQLTLYFRGPDANKIQLNFDRLLSSGYVEPYAVAPGQLNKKGDKFPYQPCQSFRDTFGGSWRILASVPLVTIMLTIMMTSTFYINR